jgi:hypothetical protein
MDGRGIGKENKKINKGPIPDIKDPSRKRWE